MSRWLLKEEDGYFVTFIIDEARGLSECLLIDAKKVSAARWRESVCSTKYASGRTRCGRIASLYITASVRTPAALT